MYYSSLPPEILAFIIEFLISEYAERRPRDPAQVKFIPQWYLTPLIRVSKLWCAICSRYLYRSLAIGSHAPFDFPVIEGESAFETSERRRRLIADRQARTGDEIARDLCRTLTTSPRLSTLIERLQLGVENFCYMDALEWMQTNIRIMQACPNVKHVEIRGFELSKLRTLVDVLKEMSLVSFSISMPKLSSFYHKRGGSFSQIVELMQKWPMLRSIRAENFLSTNMVNGPDCVYTFQASRCCPDLTEIIISGAALHPSELKLLCSMCSRDVAKLSVSLYKDRVGGNGDASAAALCECLHRWYPTLQCLKIGIRGSYASRPTLNEAISSLCELRELQLIGIKLDFGILSSLPQLERFACRSFHRDEDVLELTRHLDTPKGFPSLRHIVLITREQVEPANELPSICHRRNVQLDKCSLESEKTVDFLL